jgi:hypothetical protein
MELDIPVGGGVILKLADRLSNEAGYATSSLPKGIRLSSDGSELTEEAVGFGFPVLKRGLQTLFPGSVDLTFEHCGSSWCIRSVFHLNMVEKIHKPGVGSIENKWVYAMKNSMAAMIRHFSPVRGLLTAISSGLRRVFGWKTTYENAGFHAVVKLTHRIQEGAGKVEVEVEPSALPAGTSEVVIMNEQGARYFDRFTDSSGVCLHGDEIGCWDEVAAASACFSSTTGNVLFRLHQVTDARLYRGRELVDSRLAWAGFGISFLPSVRKLSYRLEVESQA